MIGAGISFLASAAASALKDSASNKMQSTSDKIMGIPSTGEAQKQYMDDAYPGSTMADQLSSGLSGGQANVASDQRKSEQRMQGRDLLSKLKIAKLQSKTQLESARISAGPATTQAGLSTAMQPHLISKVTQEIVNLKSQGNIAKAEAILRTALSKYDTQLAKANVSSAQTKSFKQMFLQVFRSAGDAEVPSLLDKYMETSIKASRSSNWSRLSSRQRFEYLQREFGIRSPKLLP